MKPIKIFFILALAGISAAALGQSADPFSTQQASAGNKNASLINLTVSPPHPGPQETVTATLSSNSIGIDAASITWYVNDRLRLQGTGKKSLSFVCGEVGSVTSLRAVINTVESGTIEKEATIQPNDLTVLWEADSYVPPFYKGKALPIAQSLLRVVDVPYFVSDGRVASAADLIYTWKSGYTPDMNNSGYGKNVYFIRAGYTYNDTAVETGAATKNGSLSSQKKIVIQAREPAIVFYENKPLEGIRYETAMKNPFSFRENEVSVVAEPYFFSFADKNNNSGVFNWKMDEKKLEINPEKRSEFTFRKPDTGGGSVRVRLEVSNEAYIFQTASKDLTFTYGS